jgi:hypothetical protein
MGYEFIGPTKYNRRGHFEDVEFVTLHKKIVGDWRKPCVDFAPIESKYRALINERAKKHPLWGFKDPRFCYVFPHFLRLVDRRDIKVISIRRDLKSSAKSMAYRKGKKGSSINVNYKQARAIARRYRDAHKLALRSWNGPLLIVKYETLIAKPQETVSEIASFSGVDITQRAVDFISPGLKHF